MCMGKKHKHMKGKADFSFTGKLIPSKKVKAGDTEFVKEQHETGIAKKNKGASDTSLLYVHGRK